MKSRIDNLLSRLRVFSCFWTIGGGTFLFNSIFPEIEYFGFKFYVDLTAVLVTVIGIIGAIWFIKCPNCGEKMVLKSVRDKNTFDYSKWKEDIKACASCGLKKI